MTLVKIEASAKNKEVAKALREMPDELEMAAEAAGAEAAKEILGTEGVQKYPPATAANAPPYPYYQRGLGTWTSPGHNIGGSELYKQQWTTVSEGYRTVSANTASYAPFLVDDERQAGHMAAIGWRKLGDVVSEKLEKIVAIYDGWIERAIERLGL